MFEALVAVTKHVPPDPAVSVEPEIEQEVAVPGVAT